MKTIVVIALGVAALSVFEDAEGDWSISNKKSLAPERAASSLHDVHIVGGKEAARCSEPHQVALQIRGYEAESFCGGSLISTSWILTAGHCVKSVSRVEAILGAHNIHEEEMPQENVDVKSIVVHPDYTSNLRNDIALLELVKSVVLDHWSINTIRLPSKSQKEEYFYGQPATMTGWGRESDKSDQKSSILRTVTARVISNFYCGVLNLNIMPSSQMCVSGFGGKGTCKGDSGGPLYIVENGTKTLIGVTSRGIKFCEWYFPSVFTRVATYLDWIHSVTGITPRT